jgi:hypothetical protein
MRRPPQSPQTNGICERLHKTVLNEFYRIAFRKKVYRSIDELQIDIDVRSRGPYEANGKLVAGHLWWACARCLTPHFEIKMYGKPRNEADRLPCAFSIPH